MWQLDLTSIFLRHAIGCPILKQALNKWIPCKKMNRNKFTLNSTREQLIKTNEAQKAKDVLQNQV